MYRTLRQVSCVGDRELFAQCGKVKIYGTRFTWVPVLGSCTVLDYVWGVRFNLYQRGSGRGPIACKSSPFCDGSPATSGDTLRGGYNYDLTSIRRPFDCLSKVVKVTANRSHADLFIYLGLSAAARHAAGRNVGQLQSKGIERRSNCSRIEVESYNCNR